MALRKYKSKCLPIIFVVCICFLVGCQTETNTGDSGLPNGIEYDYCDYISRASYSIDMLDETSIDYEITPEVAAYIAKGIFINIHGEEYVNERTLTVYENTESLEDLKKYGEFYEVSLNFDNYTDGEYVAISKADGRILKVYWFG